MSATTAIEVILQQTANTILTKINLTESEIKKLCTRIKSIYPQVSPYNIERIFINNSVLFGDMIQYMEDSKDQRYRPVLDVIRKILNLQSGSGIWLSWIQRYVTNIYLHFMQGITIFAERDENSSIGRPAYHRETSCGPKTSNAFEENNLKCYSYLSDSEINRRRRNIWTCTVERLVYDQLHRHFIGVQNMGHLHNERRVIQQLFETCFAITKLSILSVTVNVDPVFHVPTSMQITYETPSSIVSEKYTRKYVGPSYLMNVKVDGEKKRNQNEDFLEGFSNTDSMWYEISINAKKEVSPLPINSGPGDQYTRTQSYINSPSEWLPVNPNGGGKKWKPNCKVLDPWSL